MDEQHTPTPWFIRYCDDDYAQCMTVITNNPTYGDCNDSVFDGEDDTVAIVYHQLRPFVGVNNDSNANARRIVACVNAFENVDTESIEKISSGEMQGSELFELPKARARIKELEAQRDELSPWLPIESAPKDGTDILLLIENSSNPMQDELQSVSIGAFNIADDNEWTFAGWHWEQDCYERGDGTPIGWLPLPQPPEVE